MKTLPNLDFLRACAVLSVVLEHVLLAYGVRTIGRWNIAWIGVVGVMCFFVHTAMVLMWSLERKPHTLDFYIRRVFRIYPLGVLAVLAVWAFHAPVAGTPAQYFLYAAPKNRADIVGSLLLSHNIIGDYQSMSVMWSLPYEVQMYILLPLLFFFVQKNFSQWPLLLFWGFIIMVCRHMYDGVAHNLLLVFPYFLPGIMAYVGFSRRVPRLPAWLFPPALLGLWFAFLIRPTWRHGNVLCLVLGLGLPSFHQLSTKWLKRASHEIAKYSYGLYLAHPFAIVLGMYLMPHAPVWAQLAVILGSATALAVGAYHLVEYPLIRVGSRLANLAEKRYEQHEAQGFRRPQGAIQ